MNMALQPYTAEDACILDTSLGRQLPRYGRIQNAEYTWATEQNAEYLPG